MDVDVFRRSLIAVGVCVVLGVALAACGGGSSSTQAGGGVTEAGESATEAGEGAAEGESRPVAQSEEHIQMLVGENNFPLSKYCGEKPTVVGLIDGFGGNTWRVETRQMIENAAKECPNIGEVKYFDANLDPEKYNSTISAWAAQGVNVIVAYDDFGQTAVPAFRAAQQQGVKVVTDNAEPGNAQIPGDVTASVLPNFEQAGKEWVAFIDKAVKGTAHVAVGGAAAGNVFDAKALEGVEKAIEESGADVELVQDEPFVGNSESAKTQQAVSALLQRFPELNALVLTYVATAPSVNRAFEAAGKPLPTIAGDASSNEVVCEVREKRKTEPDYNLFSLDASSQLATLAFAKGMAAFQEIEAPELGPTDEPTVVNYAPYIDTLKNEIPPCVKSLPPGADLSVALTQQEVEKITE